MWVSMIGIAGAWASEGHGTAADAAVAAARARKSRREGVMFAAVRRPAFSTADAIPRVSDRRRVHVAFHLEHQLLSASRRELDCQKRRVDWRGLASSSDADQPMLSVAAALHDQRARLRCVEI